MEPKKFIEPKLVEIGGKHFVISKIPAVQAQQVYGKIMKECKDDGDVAMTYLSEETGLELLAFAAFDAAGEGNSDAWLSLDSVNALNTYCSNIKNLIDLQAAMIRYNFSFLFDGNLQKVLGVLRDEESA